jgi:hypothetical protein
MEARARARTSALGEVGTGGEAKARGVASRGEGIRGGEAWFLGEASPCEGSKQGKVSRRGVASWRCDAMRGLEESPHEAWQGEVSARRDAIPGEARKRGRAKSRNEARARGEAKARVLARDRGMESWRCDERAPGEPRQGVTRGGEGSTRCDQCSRRGESWRRGETWFQGEGSRRSEGSMRGEV